MKDFLVDEDLLAIREAIRKIRAARKGKRYKPKPKMVNGVVDDGLIHTWKEVAVMIGASHQAQTFAKKMWKKWKRIDGKYCPGKWVWTKNRYQKPVIDRKKFEEYLQVKK